MTSLPAELATERRHLTHARACLATMRERAGVLGDVGADAFASESLGAALAKRLAQLQDDPNTALFFGRLDQRDGDEVFHVGRRHVRDDSGDPVVIDWRAPLSRPFYRASPGEPMGVRRRRRFGFACGELTSFEDEWLEQAGQQTSQPTSQILLDEIPRVGPMRDIVATIQPDQDGIVRADLDESICRAGRPGHRQNGGRAASRRVPPLHLPRAAQARRRPGDRTQPRLSLLRRQRPARPRRDRRRAGQRR